MLRSRATWVLVAFTLAGCRTGPDLTGGFPASVSVQELDIVDQSLTDFRARIMLRLQAPPQTDVEQAHLELLLDGSPLSVEDPPITMTVGEEGMLNVILEAQGHYASTADDIAQLERRHTLTATLRGSLGLRWHQHTRSLGFLRARELRAPRLLVVRMTEVNAAHYENGEVNLVFRVGIQNTNPFPVHVRALTYSLEAADSHLSDGAVGQGDSLDPGATDVFDVQQFLDESYGDLIHRMARMSAVPWRMMGTLRTESYDRDFKLTGEVKLRGA